MKRRFTKLIAALALLLFVAPPMVGWGQTRTETVVYTLDGTTTGGSNGYETESDITQNNIAWKVTANTMQNPWRFGGKSITDEDRPAYTTTALTNNNTNITKVVITTGTATATVNSVKLIVADNSSFTSATTLTESWEASSTITFNRPTGADWTDKFFRIVYNVTVSGSSNKYAQFVKAEFYAETGTPQPTEQNLTVTLGEHIPAIYVFDAADQNNPLIADGAAGTAQVMSGTSILVSPDVADGYVLESLLVNNEDVTSQMDESGAYTFIMPASAVTITATAIPMALYTYSINGEEGQTYESTVGSSIALVAGQDLNEDFTFAGWTTDPNDVTNLLNDSYTLIDDVTIFYAVYEHTTGTAFRDEASYVKVTSTDEITDGNYLIVYETGGVAFDGSRETLDAGSNTISVDINDDAIASSNETDAAIFTIASIDGGYSVKSASGFYIGADSYDNELLTNADNAYTNSISIDENGNLVMAIAVNATQSVTLRYNSASNQNRFRYYKSGQQAIQLYKYSGGSAPTSFTAYYTRVFWGEQGEQLYDNYTVVGPSIVPSGMILNVGWNVLTNDNPANLIIEDGAQVINAVNAFEGTVFKNIAGTDFGTPEQPTNGGYYLIASPVSQPVVPSASNGFATDNWDLYAYDATEEDEWRNYNLNEGHAFANIEVHHGYLYASQENTTLSFAGTLNNFPSNLSLIDENDAIQIMPLVYANSDNDLKNLTLVGNSYAETYDFYVWDEDEEDFCEFTAYTLNDEGDGFDTDITDMLQDVAPMDAFFVLATGPNQKVVKYAQTIGRSNPKLNVKISRQNGTLLDNAIVSFAAGSMAKKLYLTDNSTRVYFPISNQDYAVVRAQSEGEQPVNFKAKENGTYTLSVETKNVEMDYLHLIDNMTGADVDLLATPSYTFEAKTSDYASRFRLVFSANSISEDADGDNAFAYFNGSSWTVSNIGEATLQVVDVMGRVLSSETLSGNAEVSINQPVGVYMLRLVSGDSVKVQKVVVR